METLIEIIFKNKEIVNLILGLFIATLPVFFVAIKVKNNKRKLNIFGVILILFCLILIGINIFFVCKQNKISYFESKKITADDIYIKLNFRYSKSFADYDEIYKKIPKQIVTPHIEIGKAVTSGIFIFQNARSGKGHSVDSKHITYICNIIGNKTIENFPTNIDSLNPKNVFVHLNIDTLTNHGFSLDGAIKLVIRNKEYWGEQNSTNRSVSFLKQ